MKKYIIILIIIFSLSACSSKEVKSIKTESHQDNCYCAKVCSCVEELNFSEAQSLVDSGALLLDVRTKEEYQEYHLEGAVNHPVEEILALAYPKETVIVLYCRSGNRSKTAALKLLEMGYTNVYDLGSINNWEGQ